MTNLIDFTGVQSINGFTIPKGKYNCCVDEASIEDSKSGGKYVKVKFRVIEGECEGKTVYNMYTVAHENPKAQQIGLGQLKALAQICGADVTKGVNVLDLVGGKLEATVNLKEDAYSGGERNSITYVKAYKPQTQGASNGLF